MDKLEDIAKLEDTAKRKAQQRITGAGILFFVAAAICLFAIAAWLRIGLGFDNSSIGRHSLSFLLAGIVVVPAFGLVAFLLDKAEIKLISDSTKD